MGNNRRGEGRRQTYTHIHIHKYVYEYDDHERCTREDVYGGGDDGYVCRSIVCYCTDRNESDGQWCRRVGNWASRSAWRSTTPPNYLLAQRYWLRDDGHRAARGVRV